MEPLEWAAGGAVVAGAAVEGATIAGEGAAVAGEAAVGAMEAGTGAAEAAAGGAAEAGEVAAEAPVEVVEAVPEAEAPVVEEEAPPNDTEDRLRRIRQQLGTQQNSQTQEEEQDPRDVEIARLQAENDQLRQDNVYLQGVVSQAIPRNPSNN